MYSRARSCSTFTAWNGTKESCIRYPSTMEVLRVSDQDLKALRERPVCFFKDVSPTHFVPQ